MTEAVCISGKAPLGTDDSALGEGVTSHFWVSTYPFFGATLLVTPPIVAEAADGSDPKVGCVETQVRFFDADGEGIATSSLTCPTGEIGVFELEPFLAMCKLESGLKHGQMVVKSPPGTRHVCRINSSTGATLLGEPVIVNGRRGGFFPTRLSEDVSALLCIINRGEVEAKVRVRLFCGNRTPDINLNIPSFASRVISIPIEFSEVVQVPPHKQLQAYLRVGVTNASSVGVQLIEHVRSQRDQGRYCSVS